MVVILFHISFIISDHLGFTLNNVVKETVIDEKIDILSMQETEINPYLNHNLLSFPGYVKD